MKNFKELSKQIKVSLIIETISLICCIAAIIIFFITKNINDGINTIIIIVLYAVNTISFRIDLIEEKIDSFNNDDN